MSRLTFSLAPFLGSIALSGCAHDRGAAPPQPTASEQQEPTGDGPTPPPGVTLAGPISAIEPAHQPATEVLDNGKIVRFTESAAAIEIAQAQLAQKRATDPAVRKLAKMIEDDHKQAQADLQRVASEQRLGPSASEMTDRFEADADKLLRELSSKSGADFDRAYVDAQVKEHQLVLDTIDRRLTPSASNPSLKAALVRIRPAIQSHLDQARTLQQNLSK